jgi:hypothetical protein
MEGAQGEEVIAQNSLARPRRAGLIDGCGDGSHNQDHRHHHHHLEEREGLGAAAAVRLGLVRRTADRCGLHGASSQLGGYITTKTVATNLSR